MKKRRQLQYIHSKHDTSYVKTHSNYQVRDIWKSQMNSRVLKNLRTDLNFFYVYKLQFLKFWLARSIFWNVRFFTMISDSNF